MMQAEKSLNPCAMFETSTFIQIIMGEKPVSYFETFVEQWYQQGGHELTQQIRLSNPST